MNKTKRKPTAREKPQQLTLERLVPLIKGLAWTLSESPADLDNLFLIAKELEHHCYDWAYVDSISNEIQRQLLIFTHEFDEAEKRCEARVRKLLKAGGDRR